MQAESPEPETWIGQKIGSHRLLRVLGRGGMGMVFEAVHEGVLGRAAIKILRPDVTSRADVTTRFFNEARAANAVQHPGIVRIFDCGVTESGVAYLSMEFLEGESLRTRLAREHQLPIKAALRIARQIASALTAAHRVSIIHRDLKPDNVMLVPDPDVPGGERVKILDFGIAKMAEGLGVQPLRTKSDVLMGTPTYMSPEQCRGAKLATDRSDVYSLGVLLYQMLAGYPPFLGASMGDLIAMHLMDEPPPLADAVPSLSPKIAKLVNAMLAKKPESRPSMDKAQQVLVRLEEAAPSLPAVESLRRKTEQTEQADSDSQNKTVDVPAIVPPATSARTKPRVDSSRALPSGIVSDTRHVRIPKRTLAMFLGAFVTSTLIVTTGILLGTQSQRSTPRSTEPSEKGEPQASPPSAAPSLSASAAPQAPVPSSSSAREETVGPRAERPPSASRDATAGRHSESARSLAPASVIPKESPQSASPVSVNPPSVNPSSVNPSSVNPPAVTAPSAEPPSVNPPSVNPPSVNPPSVNPPSVSPVAGSPQPAPTSSRGSDDPFNPLRTAEDYLLQGSYRRAMELATQFGKQEPMRAWEIYGRAACGLRWMERAQRALRELQQHHEDQRAQSLTSYCRLHKLPLGESSP